MASIIRRARWLDTLGRHLHAHLPSPLNQHARLTNIQDDALVYLVDSPIWHTRLRLSSEILLNAARGIGLEVSSLRIRSARQPFDPHMRAMAEIDTRMRHENGTTATEARALADMRVLIGKR